MSFELKQSKAGHKVLSFQLCDLFYHWEQIICIVFFHKWHVLSFFENDQLWQTQRVLQQVFKFKLRY